MAKGKGGRGGSSSGPRRIHGPKKHLFRWTGPMKWQFGKWGMLSKYYDYESWVIACQARGKRNPSKQEFAEFMKLTLEQKKEFFKTSK